jgi:anti-sigma factor RsiW
MPPMTCKECIEFLDEYLSGGLAPPIRKEFQRHLDICPPCRAFLATYKDSIRLAAQALGEPNTQSEQAIPEGLVQAILAAKAGSRRPGQVR